jgi:hypothetical protein
VQVGASAANGRKQACEHPGCQADREPEQDDTQIDSRVQLQRQAARNFDRPDERGTRRAMPSPAIVPPVDRTVLSMTNCRSNRTRLAPMARRTAVHACARAPSTAGGWRR